MRGMRRPTRWLFGVLTAAGLTFGAASAFAGARRPPCTGYHGTCSTQQECATLCIDKGFPEGGTCNASGCCLCAV
jgi:hypothetical protein